MKTPRVCLFVALLCVATAAQASTPVSLAGWTALNAVYVTDPVTLATGAPYKDGIIYCDFRTTPSYSPFSAPLLIPKINCVVVGRASKEPAGVGGSLATGQAWYQKGPSPSFVAPGSSRADSLVLSIRRVPRVNVTVMLTTTIPQPRYASYVPDIGEDMTAPRVRTPGTRPHTRGPRAKPVKPGKPEVVVPAKPAEAVVEDDELADEELLWLTKPDAEAYKGKLAEAKKLAGDAKGAALEALIKDYRAKIVENLKPGPESAAYAKVVANPESTDEQIIAALPKEPYGGAGNKEVIGPTGPKTAVQLTEEEYKKLSADARKAYDNARAGNDGNVSNKETPKFSASVYDPVALHATTLAARATITPATPPAKPGKPDGVTDGKPGDGTAAKPEAPLDDKEIALLTPAERKKYEGQRKIADATPPNASAKKGLADLSKLYRDRIKSEGRAAYPAELEGKTDITEKQFDDMQEWQKRRFCGNRPVSVATYGRDQRAAGLRGGKDRTLGLADTQAQQGDNGAQTSTNQGQGSGTGIDWDAKCKDHRDNPPDISGARQNVANGAPPDPGKDAEIKEEVKKPWVTAPLLIRGAQGALVGLLIGSLFGPVGLIAGPLIGAALFYGVSKYMTDKEADSKDK